MTIQELLTDLSGVIHGTTINKVPNVYGHINRAARTVLLDIDPKETQRIVELSQVFSDVYDYPLPSDVKGDRIVDIRPQAGRYPYEVFTQSYAQSFDANKVLNNIQKVYIQHNTGVKTIRIEAPTLEMPQTISNTGDLTGWSATAGAATLTLDSTNNVAGSGALVFNLAASSPSGYIANSTLTGIDLSAHENISSLFMWVYMPTGADITSVVLSWGTDGSNLWYSTATTTQQGTAFQNGWNLLAFDWKTATKTASPDSNDIKYVKVLFNYDSTLQTGVKVCNITSNLGAIFEIQYYSKYLFRDPTTNAFQETVVEGTDSNKLINLDTESYNLLFNKLAFYVAQSLQGADADYDATFWDNEYNKALDKYKALNPNEAMKKSESYYKMPKKGYTKYSPNIWRR